MLTPEDCHWPLLQGILVELPLAGFFLKKVRTMRADVNDLYTLDPELYNNLMFLRDYNVSRPLATWTTIAQHMFGNHRKTKSGLAAVTLDHIVRLGCCGAGMLLTDRASRLQGEFGDLALSFTTAESALDGNQEVRCDDAFEATCTMCQHCPACPCCAPSPGCSVCLRPECLLLQP